jgi:hypothetical protein
MICKKCKKENMKQDAENPSRFECPDCGEMFYLQPWNDRNRDRSIERKDDALAIAKKYLRKHPDAPAGDIAIFSFCVVARIEELTGLAALDAEVLGKDGGK